MEIKNEAKAVEGKTPPYMYDFFNISSYVMNLISMLCSKMARIINAAISALNESKKLPRLLLMILDTDFLEQIDIINPGKTKIMGPCFEWLVSQLERVIAEKKEELRQKQPGAIAANEPKIIWVSLLERKGFIAKSYLNAVITANVVMEEVLSGRKNHFWLKLSPFMADQANFTAGGELSAHGKVKFWHSIDKVVEEFDKYEISLRPVSEAERELMEQKKAEKEAKEAIKKDQDNREVQLRGFFRHYYRGRGNRRRAPQHVSNYVHY